MTTGGVVSTSKRSLILSPVSASPGVCEGASEATTLTVAAVGNQRGVEAVGFVGDFVLEQAPDGFAVAAQIERVDQVVAVVIVRGPADGDGGAILGGLDGVAVGTGVEGDAALAGRREGNTHGLLIRLIWFCGLRRAPGTTTSSSTTGAALTGR